jgi:lysophospholipase L1-like esterase
MPRTIQSTTATFAPQFLKPWVPGTTSPYTRTVGTANAGSSISGSTLYSAVTNPGLYNFWGGSGAGAIWSDNTCVYNVTEASQADNYLGFMVEFDFTGSTFELVQKFPQGSSTYGGSICWVNGVKSTQYEELTSSTNATSDVFYIQYNFGTAATRRITLAVDYAFVGIAATVAPTRTNRSRNIRRMAFITDSWGAGPNAQGVLHNYPLEVALQTGHDEYILSGQSGTGWFNDGSNTNTYNKTRSPYDSARRLQEIIACNPTTILISGSVNDIVISGYDTGLTAKATTALNTLIGELPYTNIFVLGGQYVNLRSKPQYTPIDTELTAAIAACSNPSRVTQLIATSDNTVNGTPWLTGTGDTAAPAGDGGNSDIYVNSDHLHLNAAGQYFWATNIATRMNSFGYRF